MKYAITLTALTFGLMLSGAAFAETAKPTKPVKVDEITTQAIQLETDDAQCGNETDGSKIVKLCGDGSAYPSNPLSGMNLGF
jgi:hypothetical protein